MLRVLLQAYLSYAQEQKDLNSQAKLLKPREGAQS